MPVLRVGNKFLLPLSNLSTVGTALGKGGIEMFDKLIESDSIQAEFKPRRKFFMVSSVVVGILFLTAVVASLYAHDLDLGTDTFEIAELVAPLAENAPEPEPPRQHQEQRNTQPDQQLPTRNVLIATVDQNQQIPNEISTKPSTLPTIPEGRFIFDPNGRNTQGVGPSGPPNTEVGTSSSSEPEPEVVKATDPPPVAKPVAKKPVPQTKGVVNGFAIDLPKPGYPAIAKPLNLQTVVVNVQVLINESGDVVSAKAVDGHPFFRQPAERSALQAKFKPTYLGDQAVKVNGIIVYKFTH